MDVLGDLAVEPRRVQTEPLLVGGEEGLVENKAALVSGGNAKLQLSTYLSYLDENGGSLDYNFFSNPAGSTVGPNSQFASALADAATKYDMGVHIYSNDWWDALQ